MKKFLMPWKMDLSDNPSAFLEDLELLICTAKLLTIGIPIAFLRTIGGKVQVDTDVWRHKAQLMHLSWLFLVFSLTTSEMN